MKSAKTKAKRRFTERSHAKKPMVLRDSHLAVTEGTTLFPSQVRVPDHDSILFKPGANNVKIGSHVAKGKLWAGFPIYLLSLEERATCPRVYENWNQCYGNHMPFARRWQAGEELEREIPVQLAKLAAKHPDGFVVRLHVLGDFYDVAYVALWNLMMAQYPQLNVYGYTRREKTELVGERLALLSTMYPDRWKVRWSERPGEMGTYTTADTAARGVVAEGIVCPAQTEGDEVCCGTCSLCWSQTKPIVFIAH